MNEVLIPKSPIQCQNFVNGQWIEGSGEKFDITSPYTNQVIGQSRQSLAKDIDSALNSAQKAYLNWSQVPLKERTQTLFRFRDLLLRDINTLAQQISAENGKTLNEAKAGVLKGVEVLEFALSLQNMDHGGRMEVSRSVFCEYRRESLGLVLGITPFNFPAMVPLWMIPIALALGNGFVWKPSDKTPLTSLLVATLLTEAGLPPGVMTVLQGGQKTVEGLLDHPLITAAGFVGSSPVAASVYRRGTNNLKRVLALGGAKNHILLMPDADIELAASGIADSFTGCAGQRCMAASVLLAVGDCDAIIKQIVTRAKSLQLGHNMGAIISRQSLTKIEGAITAAEKEGMKILLDGRKPTPPAAFPNGNWLAPTIVDQVKPQSQMACDELFGPVLSIIRVKNVSEALAIENNNPYGNACSVFTQNGGTAELVARSARAGMVGINVGVPVPREPFSFGGFFESKYGYGDITGIHSLNFWSQVKKVTTKWGQQADNNWMS